MGGAALNDILHETNTTDPQREGTQLFHNGLRAGNWGAVYQGEESAEQADEVCEGLVPSLETAEEAEAPSRRHSIRRWGRLSA